MASAPPRTAVPAATAGAPLAAGQHPGDRAARATVRTRIRAGRGCSAVLSQSPAPFPACRDRADARRRLGTGLDLTVTLGRCEGIGIRGLPHDAEGFIPIDRHARVKEADGIYAAGDGTTFPIKQGGIAAQQADAAAETIAAVFGVATKPRPFKPIVRDMLLTSLEPIFLRADISGGAGDSFVVDTEPLWWPPAKIAGRHMGPYLAQQEPWFSPMTLADRARPTLAEEGTLADHPGARELALALARTDAGCPECLALTR